MSSPTFARSFLGRPGAACRPMLYTRRHPSIRHSIANRLVSSVRGDENQKPDFKGQLWQSTTDRVQREKAEQERMAQQRNLGGGGTRLAVSVAVLMAAAFSYWMGTLTSPPERTVSTLSAAANTPLKHDISEPNLQAAWVDIKNIVGPEHISTTESDRESHSGSSWSSYSHGESDMPFCVVRPGSTEEVSAMMKICHKRRIPVTAYSGGTSLEGHFAATKGGVCVDFSRMDQILALHEDDLDVVVQPALGWEALNDELADHGLFFPPDPGPGAMIGGMVGTGCSGTNAYRYGTMRDWVINLTVVLADGTIVKTRQRPRKSSAGYDLTRLIIGSEGTLGLVTEATLKITSTPRNLRVVVAAFDTIKDAAACVTRTVRAGVPIAAVELLDDTQMSCINKAGTTSKKWAEKPTLFFKFSGTETAVKESIGIVQGLARETRSRTFDFARNEEEATELWQARKEALWSVMAASPYAQDKTHVWTTDVAVPISRLPEIIEITKADMHASGLVGAIVGHVGDGNFHAIINYDALSRPTAEGVVHRMVERAQEMEGTATGEHGVGLVKREYLANEVGETGVDAIRALKKTLDPLGLLNPDKVVSWSR